MRIAVIGSGISGLTAARLLSAEHEVTVFEAGGYVGGHTHTVDVVFQGRTYAVDTGFIVFNDRTYPNFVSLMKRLGVARKPSNMSFGVKCEKTGLEYSPSTPNSLFCQRRNIVSLSFYRMIADIFRFRRAAPELLAGGDDDLTLGDYLSRNGYSRAFIQHFIIPMGAAVWSADLGGFADFPARLFVEFFTHHGFLSIRNQPQWYVIQGGSRAYIPPLTAPFRDRIRLNTPVRALTRHPDHVVLDLRRRCPGGLRSGGRGDPQRPGPGDAVRSVRRRAPGPGADSLPGKPRGPAHGHGRSPRKPQGLGQLELPDPPGGFRRRPPSPTT